MEELTTVKICRFIPGGWPTALVRSGAVLRTTEGEETLVDLASGFAFGLVDREGAEPDAAGALATALFPPSTVRMLGTWARSRSEAERLLRAVRSGDLPLSAEGPMGPITHARSDVRVLSPIDRPPTVRDFFAFEDHMKNALANLGQEVPAEWYEAPSHYVTRSASVFGPDEAARWPGYTQMLDYELEFAIVIGRRGRDIRPENAWDHIAGLTICNDLSCRDVQRREMGTRVGPAKTKGFDGGTGLGPYLVTTDELPSPFHVGMRAFVNGELWSEGNSGSIHWSVEQLVEAASAGETLLPGDVLGSGTVGTGAGVEIGRWVSPGDTVRLEIDGLGALESVLVGGPSDPTS